MLNSVFAKTIFEKRWSTLIWFFAIFATTVFIGVLFPTFRDTFGASLQDVPESLKTLLGDAETYQTLAGYVDIQVINQMIFFTIIMSVIVGTSLIAGEESSGILQTLLAHPINRAQVYFQKLSSLAIMTLIVTFGLFFGVLASGILVSESMDWGRLAMATLMTWLITFVFGVMAFSLGALSGKRGLAGVIAGGYAFIAYIITNLAGTATSLKTVDYASPFHYFNNPSVIKTGLDWTNIGILIGISALLTIVGWYAFKRRDIQLK